MAFFKREHSPVERFEGALRSKQAERQKLSERLSLTETVLSEKRAAAERLAVAGASNAKLERADAELRSVEDRVKTLRGSTRGVILLVLKDGRVVWRPDGTKSELTGLPESLLPDSKKRP